MSITSYSLIYGNLIIEKCDYFMLLMTILS